jgi:flagellar motor switch protein FliN/FliY
VWGGARDAWLSTGRKVLARAGSAESNDETALSASREMVAKGVNTFASMLSSKLNRAITVEPPQELDAAPESISLDALTRLEIEFHDESRIGLNLIVDPKFTTALCVAEKDMNSGTAGPTVNTKNLDLLLDVEMPVSVSFGRAQLPLKHLIKLTTGSIVELGRSVSEPVDIIVNNTVIARGEVVVVAGNFGVRIKEILSKQDRLRTLT